MHDESKISCNVTPCLGNCPCKTWREPCLLPREASGSRPSVKARQAVNARQLTLSWARHAYRQDACLYLFSLSFLIIFRLSTVLFLFFKFFLKEVFTQSGTEQRQHSRPPRTSLAWWTSPRPTETEIKTKEEQRKTAREVADLLRWFHLQGLSLLRDTLPLQTPATTPTALTFPPATNNPYHHHTPSTSNSPIEQLHLRGIPTTGHCLTLHRQRLQAWSVWKNLFEKSACDAQQSVRLCHVRQPNKYDWFRKSLCSSPESLLGTVHCKVVVTQDRQTAM